MAHPSHQTTSSASPSSTGAVEAADGAAEPDAPPLGASAGGASWLRRNTVLLEVLIKDTLPGTNMECGERPRKEDHDIHYKHMVNSTSMLVFGSVSKAHDICLSVSQICPKYSQMLYRFFIVLSKLWPRWRVLELPQPSRCLSATTSCRVSVHGETKYDPL